MGDDAAGRPAALVVIHYFPPHVGGMEIVAVSQAASLARRGHPVTVVTCAHEGGLPRTDDASGYRVRRIRALNFIERRFGVTFPVIGPVGAWRLVRAVRRAEIVHIHDVFYMTSHVAVLAAKLLRRPYFLTQHVALVPHPSRLVMGVQRLVYATIGKLAFRGAERVVVYNARVRDFVVGKGVPADRVLLNHNGIDTDLYRPLGTEQRAKAEFRQRYGLPADRPIALFAGRLVPKKGYDLVMGAASPGWTTVIVGDGAGAPVEGGPDVVMFGAATQEQMADLYRMSDVFVFPAEGEMLTLVMQEAMASGLPVITTDDPAYGEYGLDRERIAFVQREPGAIRDAIAAVLTEPGRAAAMSAYSRQLAEERFTWEANYVAEYAIYPAGTDTPGEVAAIVPSLAG